MVLLMMMTRMRLIMRRFRKIHIHYNNINVNL